MSDGAPDGSEVVGGGLLRHHTPREEPHDLGLGAGEACQFGVGIGCT